MSTRKVQVTGGNTYIVSLPKTWVKESDLKQGDVLELVPQNNGDLWIRRPGAVLKDSSKIHLRIHEKEVPARILKRLLACYISGYTIMEIKAEGRMTSKQKRTIRDFCRRVIGPEIMEESVDRILIRDLMPSSGISMKDNVYRFFSIVKGMFFDVLESLSESDSELAADVISRKDECVRLHHLIQKQFNVNLTDPDRTDIINEMKSGFFYLRLSSVLMEISGSVDDIAHVVQYGGLSENKDLTGRITVIGKKAFGIVSSALSSPGQKEMDSLLESIDGSKEIKEEINAVIKELVELDMGESVHLTRVITLLANVAGRGAELCEMNLPELV